MPNNFIENAILCLHREQQAEEEYVWQHAGTRGHLSLMGDRRIGGHSF